MHLKLYLFPYPSIYTCVLVAQKNRLIESVLLSTHNWPQDMFWLRKKKNNFPVCTFTLRTGGSVRGQKFHSSARIDEWILERTSDSSQSARPTGRVLKSEGETSIF